MPAGNLVQIIRCNIHAISAAILKSGVPNPELTTECEALQPYNGQGIVLL
jgi:hypothetical protein